MAGRLADKVAIVTGAGSGIGRRAAERFAEEGATVVCADVVGARETAAAIAEAGGRAVGVPTDVTDPAATEAMAAAALEHGGRIDVLFANAGVPGIGTTAGTDPADWDHVIRVNLTGVWLSVRAVLPAMTAQRGGSIIATASTAAIKGMRGIAPYAASKAGVVGLCRATAVEVGPVGIRVNAIAPGTTPTPLVTETFATLVGGGGRADDARTALALEREQERYPMRRFGTLDEVVAVAVFLASDESGWVTGGVHAVDGGLSAA